MRLKNYNSILTTFIFFGSIFVLYLFLSNKTFDAINYLNLRGGSESIKLNTDRTDLTFLLLYPFSFFGVQLGGLFYISFFSFLLINIFQRLQSIKIESGAYKKLYSLEDFFIFIPYYYQAILLPGKESIIFFLIFYIYLTFYKLNNLIKNEKRINNKIFINLILSLLIVIIIRPPILFMLPASILFAFPTLSELFSNIKFTFRFNIKKLIILSMIIVFIFSSISILIFSQELIIDGVIGILRALVFDIGRTTTGSYDYYGVKDNLNKFIPMTLSSFIFGFPVFPELTSNKFSMIIGSTHFLSTIYFYSILLRNILQNKVKNIRIDKIIYKKLYLNINSILINILLLSLFLFGGYILSIGLTINTGSGMRYALPYIQILWLTSVYSRILSNK